MVKYVDKSEWVEQVLMPDESTPILGGMPDWDSDNMLSGWSNVPAGQLADRTRFLHDRIQEIEQDIEQDGENSLQKDNNLSDLQDVGQAKFNLGLNLVDNTRDLDKPVSNLIQDALDTKVDKEAGKGLSSNDFTTAEKNKLSGIQAGAQVNVATNLGVGTRTTTSVPVTSSTGSAATLPAATTTLAGVMSSADKTKLVGIEVGATANATDAQLRDRATHTGVQPIASVEGLQDALDEKVNDTDTRLTDAREWTASIVSQAVAEAGTSILAYKWTAQRVRQAILGWWNSISVPTSKLTGTLSVAQGGTGADTLTGLVKGNGTAAMTAAVASDVPALNASKAQVLNGTNNLYVSGGTYLNVISWNDMGSLSANTSINLDTSLNHSLTAAASLTLDATNVDPGKTGDIVINTPTAVTVSWAAKWKFLGSVPNIGGAGETWVVSYKVFDANTIYASAVKVA